MKTIFIQRYESPCGMLVLGSCDGLLCLCDWEEGRRHTQTMKRMARALNAVYRDGCSDVTQSAARQLDEYFAGQRREFSLPLMAVGTDFQRAVWAELQRIPFGRTISYGEQSRRMGRPEAVRAVASANGSNPLSVIIPCHRVVGAGGSLTGYAGGLGVKHFLLALEQGGVLGVDTAF